MAERACPLTLADFAQAKGFTSDELARFGVRESFDRIEIPYYNADGSPFVRMRTRADLEHGFRWTKGEADIIPYGLWRPVPVTHEYITVVEGESDCWACWLGGIPAIGVPGATATSTLHAIYFADIKRVAVVQEPGDAGARFPFRVAQRLRDTGYTGEVFAITLGKYKDARDAFIAGRDTFSMRMADAYRARKPVEALPVNGAVNDWPEFTSFAQLLDRPHVAVNWLVDGLIPTGGAVLLVSKPKVGKSVLARNIAYAVATGAPVLERETRAGPVLWLGFEEHLDFVREEFERLGAARDVPIYFAFQRAPQDALAWLENAANTLHPALVIVDTWVHLTRVKDVNDYAAVSAANAPLVAL